MVGSGQRESIGVKGAAVWGYVWNELARLAGRVW